MIGSQCLQCRRYRGRRTCDAFLDGIPRPVITGRVPHSRPYPGDDGMQFEPYSAVGSVEKVVWKDASAPPEARTVDEAERWARRYAADSVEYGDGANGLDVDAANQVNQALYEVIVAPGRRKLREVVIVDSRKAALAEASSDDRISLYPSSWNAVTVDRMLRGGHGARFAFGDTLHDVMIHELGHILHYRMPEKALTGYSILGGVGKPRMDGALSVEARRAAERLSDHAAVSPEEYFAEAFSVYRSGDRRLIDPDVARFVRRVMAEAP